MIVIKVEVWPGGNLARSREIARCEIENRSDSDEINGETTYRANWTEGKRTVTRIITNHHETDSILELIKKSLP